MQQAVYVVNTPLMATPPNTTAPAPTSASTAFATAYPLAPGNEQACISLLDAAGASNNTQLFYQLALASKYVDACHCTTMTLPTGLRGHCRGATSAAR